jgi:hypothetical protein
MAIGKGHGKGLDFNKQLDLDIFLDLSKAFDIIDHDLMLAKLEWYEFRGISYEWIRSYLTARSQFAEIHHMDQNTSMIKTVTSTLKEIKKMVCLRVRFWGLYCFLCL